MLGNGKLPSYLSLSANCLRKLLLNFCPLSFPPSDLLVFSIEIIFILDMLLFDFLHMLNEDAILLLKESYFLLQLISRL